MQTIGERLRARRSQLEITQAEAGRRAGLSRQAVNAIETEFTASPSIATVAALAKALIVDFEWLATGEGKPPKGLDNE
ncbi:transcriptional repressor [Serratia phage Scapp]|uniref:Transcriptional repressor n=1 Tax=Serratia phage Scapp TaxID=2282409 RepID=A0A345L6T4_9CAUD|nr:transcriptional repressor [Serratia phage Scapp]AXH50986.1 transcriptional repressor [Serratia phage Scapp]